MSAIAEASRLISDMARAMARNGRDYLEIRNAVQASIAPAPLLEHHKQLIQQIIRQFKKIAEIDAEIDEVTTTKETTTEETTTEETTTKETPTKEPKSNVKTDVNKETKEDTSAEDTNVNAYSIEKKRASKLETMKHKLLHKQDMEFDDFISPYTTKSRQGSIDSVTSTPPVEVYTTIQPINEARSRSQSDLVLSKHQTAKKNKYGVVFAAKKEAIHCFGCSKKFSLRMGKTHCRQCGGVFCSYCIKTKIFVEGSKNKKSICDGCVKEKRELRRTASFDSASFDSIVLKKKLINPNVLKKKSSKTNVLKKKSSKTNVLKKKTSKTNVLKKNVAKQDRSDTL